MKLTSTTLRLAPLAVMGILVFACSGSDTTVGNTGGDGGTNTDGGAGDDGASNTDGGSNGDGGMHPDSGLTCPKPTANCSGNASDGCNVNTNTDNANCGGCGVVCATTCTNGVCPLISPDAGAPPHVGDNACIAIDATNVYWATGLSAANGGSVYKIPINGGTPVLVAGMQAAPHGIASDGTSLFWTNGASGEIMKAAIAGGQATAIVNGQNGPTDVVVSGNAIYWANNTDGSIWTSDKNGGSPMKLAGPNGQNDATHIRANGSVVFWSDTAGGAIDSVPFAGGSTTPVTMVAITRYLDVDSTYVYFGAGSGAASTINRAMRGGGAATAILMAQPNAQGIVVDGANIYWANGGAGASTGTINRAASDGTNPTALAMGRNFPGCIAVDATSVYWIDEGGGAIVKTGK